MAPASEHIRRNPPYADGRDDSDNTPGWWSANQRGKLSIGVDLKDPEGKQIIRDLAARSDIVVENFSPGVVGRLGIGYEDLSAILGWSIWRGAPLLFSNTRTVLERLLGYEPSAVEELFERVVVE